MLENVEYISDNKHGKTCKVILCLSFWRNELAKSSVETVINSIFPKKTINKQTKKTWKSFNNSFTRMLQSDLYLSWPLLELTINIDFKETPPSAYPEKGISYLISPEIIILGIVFLVVSNIIA